MMNEKNALSAVKFECERVLNENRDWENNPFADALMAVHHYATRVLDPKMVELANLFAHARDVLGDDLVGEAA
ncbi:MAG: hypothetical protein WDZ59_01400 [Pirellulales bacterium]